MERETTHGVVLTDVPQVLLVEDVARLLRCSAETVRRHIRQGRIPSSRLGNRRYVLRADLARVLAGDEGRGRAQAEPPESREGASADGTHPSVDRADEEPHP